MKKRGFGVGKWNGVGGKVDANETIEEAAVRECQEEIDVTPYDLQYIGRLHFYEQNDPEFHHDCHIFITTRWEGEPAESEEMRPQWFPVQKIPYHTMWADDTLWYPLMLDGKQFKGTITLDGDKVYRHDITIEEQP